MTKQEKERHITRTRNRLMTGFLISATILMFIVGFQLKMHIEGAPEGGWSTEYMGFQPYADTIERNDDFWEGSPEITPDLLDPNPYSRPQTELKQINGVVIHYTANPGATAKQNRDYFNNLQDGKGTKASSHFIIGLDGEIIQCIPLREVAYASNDRNYDTISIEVCHEDDTGKFNRASYDSLVKLTGWLCKAFRIPPDNMLRHYDVTGKLCPKYYVEHSQAWDQLKADIKFQYEVLSQI